MSTTSEPTAKGCPVLAGFDPLTPENVRNPFPALARAQREMPVFFLPELDRWCVTRYDDVEEVLAHPEVYSSSDFVDLPFPPAIAEQLPSGHPLDYALVTTDPPAHTRMRRLSVKAFTPRQAAAQADAIRLLANALIDGFIEERQVDLAHVYCAEVPIRVIGPIFGVPSDEAATLYRWAMEALVLVGNAQHLSQEQVLELGQGQVEFDRAVRAIVADRRENLRGADDLLTSLISAEDDEGAPALSDSEIVGMTAAAIAAGSDTAATTMTHCIRLLLEDRSRWQEILDDPARIPNAIEETLRFNGPARSLLRTTTRETTLGGVILPKGAKLLAHITAASRDESVFPHADVFDMHRTNPRQHLAFGRGIHFCIGAPLARTEMRVAIETLAQRIPTLRLVPGHQIEYMSSIQVLPVTGGLVVEWD